MEWEYNTVYLALIGSYEKDIDVVNRMLNEQGKQGWELVSAINVELLGRHPKKLHYIFKRPKK